MTLKSGKFNTNFFYPRMTTLQMFSLQELQVFLVNHLKACNYTRFEFLYFPISCKELQWTLVTVNSVLSSILFTNARCLLFSM